MKKRIQVSPAPIEDYDYSLLPTIEHLTPENWLFDHLWSVEYHQAVHALLVTPVANKSHAWARVICLPSFEPEWALHLLPSEEPGCRLVLRQAQEMIWGSQKIGAGTVAVVETEANMNAALTARTEQLWHHMLFSVKQVVRMARTKNGKVFGLATADGVSYHFMDAQLQSVYGQCHSPGPHTPAGRLTALADALRDFVQSTERTTAEQVVSRAADELQQALEIPPAVDEKP